MLVLVGGGWWVVLLNRKAIGRIPLLDDNVGVRYMDMY